MTMNKNKLKKGATEYRLDRKKLGLTQPQLASLLGITKRTVQHREKKGASIEASLAMDSLLAAHKEIENR